MKKILIVLMFLLVLTSCRDKEVKIEDCDPGYVFRNGECREEVADGAFTSSDDILNLYTSFAERQELLGNVFGWSNIFTDAMDMEAEDSAPSANEKQTGSDDYSETNNQVDGVDEMDNVLTDGKYIYVQNWEKIQIILAYTLEQGTDVLSLVKEITFDELAGENTYFYPMGMYVDGERFIVVGSSYDYTCLATYEEKTEDEETPVSDENTDAYYQECMINEYHSYTHVMEFSKDTFELENEYKLSGYFVGSRKIGDNIYFVTNEYIPYYYSQYEDYDFSLDTFLPNYTVNDTDVTLGYEDIVYVEGTEPSTFTTFYGIDLDTQGVTSEVILGEGGYNLYVSTQNIYLTGVKWNYNEILMLDIEEALENDEEIQIEENPYEVTTSIIKISINDGRVNFEAQGDVPGIALDQFAMDEKDGYIRIVTTTNNWWWWGGSNEINNRLMVLNESLEILSTLENIGKEGESVQATRFVGNYAYVVTFLRTDPFYVIDLSDPLQPEVLSELEIPGFSDYLQPIGEDYMLGIGYGDNDGGTQGLKISLYDVSDKTNAVVASEIVYPYADNSYIWTSTVYNHKDLLVSTSKNIIALPYTLNDYSSNNWSYHTGVLVLNLDLENGEISERAMVEHSEANSYDTYVFKSKFISDYLYTISSKYVKVSTIVDPETILNDVQIGESHYIEYPDEVEPIDPVDPEPTCIDGDILVNGECVTEGTGTDPNAGTLFEDLNHLATWEQVLLQDQTDYYVYVYSTNCELCREIETEIFEYAMNSDSEFMIYFVDISVVEDGDILVDAVPTLIKVVDGVISTEYVGIDEILDTLQQQ